MEKSKVVVLLSAFNGMKYLPEQIGSILNQIEINVEVYISVDLSVDGTYEWCLELSKNNKRIKLLPYGKRFGGAARNFFRLICDVDMSNYDYISFADQDDIWLPNKLIHAIKTIKKKKVSGLSSDVIAFFKDGRELLIKKSFPRKRFDHYFESGGPGCTYVIERDAFLRFKDFLLTNFKKVKSVKNHDWLIYAFFRKNSLKWFIDTETLIRYRVHDKNQIGPNSGIKASIKRFNMLRGGWYRKEVESIRALIDPDNQSGLQLDRLSLIRNFCELRRSPKDTVFFLMILLIGIY